MMCRLSVPSSLLVLFITFTLFIPAESRDICNLNVVLREIDTFKLSQTVKKEVPLDFSAYSDLFDSLSENKQTFADTVLNYTVPATYTDEEPYILKPLDSDHNIFKLEALRDDFALECYKRHAKMVSIEKPSFIAGLKAAMKADSLDKIPIASVERNGYITTFDGIYVAKADGITANSLKTWVDLKKDGGLAIPTSAEQTAASTVKVSGYCYKPNNFWDRTKSNKHIFMNLAKKMFKELPNFGKQIDTFKKKFNGLSTTESDPLALQPSTPLARLSSLLKKYSTIDSWQATTQKDFPVFTEIFKLLKNSKKYFNMLSQDSYSVNPSAMINKLNFDPVRYEGGDRVKVLTPSSTKSLVSASVTDGSDEYVLFKIRPHVHKKIISAFKYMIKGATKSFLFTEMPTLLHCSAEPDTVKTCKTWLGDAISGDCADFITGKISKMPPSCPTLPAPSETSAIRTDCQTSNGLVISTSKKKSTLRVYCDGIFETQFTISTPLKSLPSTCELKELNGEIETIIAPQLNFDLIENEFDPKENIFKFEEPNDEFDLVALLYYIVPIGFGMIAFIGFTICFTAFCMKPALFIDMCNCLLHRNVRETRPDSKASRDSAPHSQVNSPLNSRPQSRAVSPARSYKAVDFTHTFRD